MGIDQRGVDGGLGLCPGRLITEPLAGEHIVEPGVRVDS